MATLSVTDESRIRSSAMPKAPGCRSQFIGITHDELAGLDRRLMARIDMGGTAQYRLLHGRPGARYAAFVDPSGGSSDSFTLAISHRDGDLVVIDAVRERHPPFSPESVVHDFSVLLAAYNVSTVTGDRYAGEWPREQFRKRGMRYECAAQPKSDLFRDLLPLLNSGRVVLPRSDRLVSQICQLERRVSRAGRDSIDHGPGGHDDLANAVAGAAAMAAVAPRLIQVGHFDLWSGRIRWRDEREQPELYRAADGSLRLRSVKGAS